MLHTQKDKNMKTIYFIITLLFLFDMSINANESQIKDDDCFEIYELIIGDKWQMLHKSMLVSAAELIQNKVIDDKDLDSLATVVIKRYEEKVNLKIIEAINNGLDLKDVEPIKEYINHPMNKKLLGMIFELNSVSKIISDSVSMEFMGIVIGKIK